MTRRIRVDARKFAAAHLFASKDKTLRSCLCGVYIEPQLAGGVILVATDGHRMAMIRDETGSADTPAICTLPPAFLTQCAKGKRYPRVVIFEGDAGTILEVRAEATAEPQDTRRRHETIVASTTALPVGGTFPDWRRVLPRMDANPPGEASYQPRYIADFSKAAAILGHDGGAVTIRNGSGNGPAWVSIISPDFIGVLMPMRGYGLTAIPNWVNPKPAGLKVA